MDDVVCTAHLPDVDWQLCGGGGGMQGTASAPEKGAVWYSICGRNHADDYGVRAAAATAIAMAGVAWFGLALVLPKGRGGVEVDTPQRLHAE